MYLDSTVLNLNNDPIETGANQLVGLRFLVDIPQGTTIASSKIQFTGAVNSAGDVAKLIKIENSDDAARFKADPFNISSRIPTGSSVTWDNIPDWISNEATFNQATPDLTSLVQEIINKPGWAPGNGMAFIISGTGETAAFSHDGSKSKAPQLVIRTAPVAVVKVIEIAASDDDAEEVASNVILNSNSIKIGGQANEFAGLRFLVDIPSGDEGVVITSARIQFTSESNTSVAGVKEIRIEDSDNAATFDETDSFNISSRDTIGLVDWVTRGNLNNFPENLELDVPDWDINEVGTTQATPDLTSLVQEIIDKPGWAPLNGMAFIISGTGEQHAFSYDGSPSPLKTEAPKLIIAYTTSALSDSKTLVSHNDDDAEEKDDTLMILDGHSLKIGGDQLAGLRFLANIPSGDEGVVITSAKIQFTSADGSDGAGVNTIAGEYPPDGDADRFTSTNGNISSRTTTSGSVVWALEGNWETGDSGDGQATPDLTAIVQEIIDHPDWEFGNGMAFIITGDAVQEDQVFSHDSPASNPPQLIITYTTVVNVTEPAPPTTHPFVIPGYVYETVGPFDGAFEVTANVFDGDDVGVGSVLVHVRYGTDGESDYLPPIPQSNFEQGRTLPLKFAVTDVFGNEVQTPHANPRITTDDGSGPIDGICLDPLTNTTSEFARFNGDKYICNLQTLFIPRGTVTIAIHLDDGIDPSTIPADREITLTVIENHNTMTDGAEENKSNGAMSLQGSFELHDDGGDGGYMGMRFTDLRIPKDAEIESAKIQFTVDSFGNNSTLNVTFVGEDVDDSAPYDKDDAGNLSTRFIVNPPTVSVPWDNVPHWVNTADRGSAQLTIDLAEIIQEIVSRDGWVGGNDLNIMITSTSGTGERHAENNDDEYAFAPELITSYIPPEPPGS